MLRTATCGAPGRRGHIGSFQDNLLMEQSGRMCRSSLFASHTHTHTQVANSWHRCHFSTHAHTHTCACMRVCVYLPKQDPALPCSVTQSRKIPQLANPRDKMPAIKLASCKKEEVLANTCQSKRPSLQTPGPEGSNDVTGAKSGRTFRCVSTSSCCPPGTPLSPAAALSPPACSH